MSSAGELWGEQRHGPGGGPPPTVKVVRETLRTNRHAQMLFDMAADMLGEEAFVESAGGGQRWTLYRREGETIFPWPLLRLGLSGRLSTVVPVAAPPGASFEPPPRPGEPPKLSGLGPGEFVVHDGPHSITVTYGEDGRWMETSRSRKPGGLPGVVAAVEPGTAQPTELIAQFVAGLDVARHGPGRVRLPVPLPRGVAGVWRCGLHALREALFDERVPAEMRWVVADGYAGTARGWGEWKEAALEAWRLEVERLSPRPPKPAVAPPDAKDSIEPIAAGPGQWSAKVTLVGHAVDVPHPDPAPENTPSVLLPLAPAPPEPPPFGSWVRLISDLGATVHAAKRIDVDGFTLVGEDLAGHMELDDLDERLDAADRSHADIPRAPWPEDAPPLTSKMTTYRLVDEDRIPVTPQVVASSMSPAFHARDLDGDRLRWHVLRQRRRN